jgi:crotonobetainyl-CoA:carnitine CoA-transferase CaiB-like acyl-CoA transferase
MGPYCSRVLADLGADVIKVESPGGDLVRGLGTGRNPGMGPVFLSTNRGKRGIEIDLKAEAGRAALRRMAERADVLLHNLRPAAAARLELDPERLRAANPRLVYCAVVGFGGAGPYRDDAAYDDVIQAISGLAALQGGTGDPAYVKMSVADKVVGLMASTAVTAALLRRERTGRGEAIEVPMFETMVSFTLLEQQGGMVYDPPLGPPGYLRTASPFRRPYRTAEGHLAVMIYTDRQWARFFELIGRPELADDPRYRTVTARTEHVDGLYQLLEGALREHPSAWWARELGERGIAATPVRDLAGLFDDEHLAEVGMFTEVEHPSEGTLRLPRQPVRFTEAPAGSGGMRPAPRLGEHSRQVLAEAGLSAAEIDALVESGVVGQAPPVSGVHDEPGTPSGDVPGS